MFCALGSETTGAVLSVGVIFASLWPRGGQGVLSVDTVAESTHHLGRQGLYSLGIYTDGSKEVAVLVLSETLEFGNLQ